MSSPISLLSSLPLNKSSSRTFALQHRRPVRLRNCIAKPDIVNSACPVVMNDLYNHIGIFEALPPSLYEWHPQSDAEQPRGVALAHEIDTKLCVVQATDSMIESQRFDTLITQQWLRVALWRLVFGENPSPSHNSRALLPFSTPVDVGRTIMETLHSVRQSSIDCHGIAIVSNQEWSLVPMARVLNARLGTKALRHWNWPGRQCPGA